MLIAIGPKRLYRILLVCIVALVGMHILAVGAAVSFPGPVLQGLRGAFDLNEERNAPSKYSALQLALATALLVVLFRNSRGSSSRDKGYWLVLAAVFAFLTADEYFSIHERLDLPVKNLLGPGGTPKFAWVIPYAGLLAVFAVGFFRFWWRQSREIRWQLAVAGSIYIGGAMGMELIGSRLSETVGDESAWYLLEVVIEESMELVGIALFIRTLATLIESRVGAFTFQFGSRAIDSHEELMSDIEAADRRKGDRRAG
jgi:hypothetical protein